MKIIVTGSAGFIGFHVARALLQSGLNVTGIDNLTEYYDPALKQARLELLHQSDHFTFHKLDMADHEAVNSIFETQNPDIVIHLAAQAGVRYSIDHPFAYLQSNLAGFLSVINACRAVNPRHFLYASTSSIYGANTAHPYKETHLTDHTVSLYAATKKSNEAIAHAYSHLYDIPCSGLRFFTVYGPWGRPDMAYYKFTKAIFDGTPIDIYNNGQMFRDFTYIDDIVDGIIKLKDHPAKINPDFNTDNPVSGSSGIAPFQIYNIGNSHVVPLLAFIDTLEDVIGIKARRNYLPMQAGDVHLTSADTSKLETVTGFRPNTSLRDGLTQFVDWYRTYHNV